MLHLVTSAKQLDFPALMNIYAESLKISARQEYPKEPPALGQLFAEQDFRGYLHDSFFQTDTAFCALWEAEDRMVAALRVEPYRDGMIVAGLEVAPDYRRKGYATMLLAEIAKTLRGRRIYSHVKKSNGSSLRVHEKCGFKVISQSAVYLDGSVMSDSYTLLLEA
jgi:GNAT superfamily N-acetyltransferase